jgi:anti-sigma regulatory factor (Ser/Thr protein kinase)
MTERVRPRLGLDMPGPPRTCSQTYPGRPDQVREARAFVAAAVRGCPAADEVVLMADEIAANAVLYSHSNEPGGVFTVRVEVCAGHWVQVLVDDAGSPQPPRLRGTDLGRARHAAVNGGAGGAGGVGSAGSAGSAGGAGGAGGAAADPGAADPGAADPGGRGLRIVDALADAWGVAGDVIGRTVWFRAGWGAP